VQRGAERRGLAGRLAAAATRWVGADSLSGVLAEPERGVGPRSGGPWRQFRYDPGRRGVLALLVVASLAFAGAGWWVWSARPQRWAVPAVDRAGAPPAAVSPGGSLLSPLGSAPSRAVTSAPSAGLLAGSAAVSAAVPAAGPPIVVDVVGRVRRPGVYRLPPGARVNDAIAAAGGVAGGVDLATVNLARRLSDGEQVAVGVTGASGVGAAGAGGVGAGGAGASGPGAGGGLLDLNTATESQFDGLPGVGPVLAQRIVAWRAAHGRFSSVDELRSVSGIGDSKFADLKPLVTVS
jgi:competence protein ComEA